MKCNTFVKMHIFVYGYNFGNDIFMKNGIERCVVKTIFPKNLIENENYFHGKTSLHR